MLAKLKDKYKEEFVITKVKTYKEEKIGLNWVIAEVVSKENSSKTATVYARNTVLFGKLNAAFSVRLKRVFQST